MNSGTLKVGIEQEFVFIDSEGRYLDGENADYATFSQIVAELPEHEGDEDYLECKSLEQFPKRCYVEGFERHDVCGTRIDTLPKGLEIRTLPHADVVGVVREFRQTYGEIMRIARRQGLSPVLTSRHPFKTRLALDSQVGIEERAVRTEAELALATRAMLSHGLHVNVSFAGSSAANMQDLAEKVNYYMSCIIPWSFSSPFYEGRAFDGLCCRNHFRAETRRMVDVHDRKGALVLEFRGFDACGDARLLTAVLELYCGFLQDSHLAGRMASQDAEQIRRSSRKGFGDPELKAAGGQVLQAARAARPEASDSWHLLETMLAGNDSYASRMLLSFEASASILESISGQYDY
jgi:hypothetical protein